MIQWPMWLSIHKVLDALRCDLHQVAIGNMVPFRTRDNSVYAAEFRNAWRVDLAGIVDILKPALIVKMTGGFNEFHRLCPPSIEVGTP